MRLHEVQKVEMATPSVTTFKIFQFFFFLVNLIKNTMNMSMNRENESAIGKKSRFETLTQLVPLMWKFTLASLLFIGRRGSPPPPIPAHHWSSASLPYHGEANIKSFSNESPISGENNFYLVRSWHVEIRSHITTVLGPVRETGKDMNGWKSNGNKIIIILVMVIRPEERSNWVYSFIFIWTFSSVNIKVNERIG